MKPLLVCLTVGLLGLGSLAANAGVAGPLDRWSLRASGTTNTLNAIAYANKGFVVVGNGGTTLNSPDGVTWTSYPSGTAHDLHGVTWANNLFVAVGESGTILSSPDGHEWNLAAGQNAFLQNVTYGANTWVVVGGFESVIPPPSGDTSDLILTSPETIQWTRQRSGTNDRLVGETLLGVAYGNGTLVAVGSEAYVPDQSGFPVAGSRIRTSPDGTNWVSRSSHDHLVPLFAVAYGKSTFVACGGSGLVVTSPDGITWTTRNSGTTNDLHAVAYGNNTFIAGGAGGTILSSTDAITWASRKPGVASGLRGIRFGNNRFVAVGQEGTILNSGLLGSIVAQFLLKGAFNGGAFELTVNGAPNQSYLIQSADTSSGIIPWQTVMTFTMTNSPFTWRDTTATNHNQRLYRARTQP